MELDHGSTDQVVECPYQGHASIRFKTPEGNVVYVDPYDKVKKGYEETADVILITDMRHPDHNCVNHVRYRSEDCKIITPSDVLKGLEHKTVYLGYLQIESVEAGYNALHDVRYCVGYILTFSNGVTVYISGDTAHTPQMPELASRNLDYAFFCCDGIYTMTVLEAKRAAEMVQAKHSIPYHMSISKLFDEKIAERFNTEGAMIMKNDETFRMKNAKH